MATLRRILNMVGLLGPIRHLQLIMLELTLESHLSPVNVQRQREQSSSVDGSPADETPINISREDSPPPEPEQRWRRLNNLINRIWWL